MAHIKDTYYFSHDSNARSDPKILALRSVYGMEGYGRFWILVEMLREQPGYKLKLNSNYASKAIAKELECDEDAAIQFVQDCIEEFELFETDGEYFWSNSLLRRMELRKEKSEKARRAAMARWKKEKKSDSNAGAMQAHSKSNASKVKESKEKEKESTKDIRQDSLGPDVEIASSEDECHDEEKQASFDQDSKPFEAAAYLRARILSNNPRARVPNDSPQDSLMQKWALEMDRLNRIGPLGQDPQKNHGYSWEEIRAIIDFCQDDGFWQSNILSPSKLREQIVTLENQMKRSLSPRGDPTKLTILDMKNQKRQERGVLSAKSRRSPKKNRFAGLARDAGTGKLLSEENG